MFLPVQVNDFRPDRSPWCSLMNFQLTKKIGNSLQTAFNPDGTPSASNPNGYTFDTEYNYAPIQGIRGFLGLRYTLSGKRTE